MYLPELKFSGPIEHTTRNGRPISIHPPVEQFGDYVAAMSPVYEARNDELERDDPLHYSSVHFSLPYTPKRWHPWLRPPKIMVVGDGLELKVFTEAVYSPRQAREGSRDLMVMKLFDTEGFDAGAIDGFRRGHFRFRQVDSETKQRIYATHTTEVKPFLKGDYPPHGLREYALWAGQGDSYLKITSDIQENSYHDRLTIVYEGDHRDWLPYTVVDLQRDENTGLWFYNKPTKGPQRVPVAA